MTRFLLYSNQFDIEGLVATTSTWQRDKISPEIINRVLSNYGKVRSNLAKHADGFLRWSICPIWLSPDSLLTVWPLWAVTSCRPALGYL